MNHEMTTANATPAPITNRLRELGERNPDWDPIAELNPDWTERFVAMGTKPMMSGVLDPKTVEFIAIARRCVVHAPLRPRRAAPHPKSA